jgi:hypothetical protein
MLSFRSRADWRSLVNEVTARTCSGTVQESVTVVHWSAVLRPTLVMFRVGSCV